LTHADKRNDFLVEADVAASVPRMEQAAYDVLMNKKYWRSPGVERRNLWEPPYGSAGTAGSFFVANQQNLALSFKIMDPYGSWECDSSTWSPPMPKGWWKAFPDEIVAGSVK